MKTSVHIIVRQFIAELDASVQSNLREIGQSLRFTLKEYGATIELLSGTKRRGNGELTYRFLIEADTERDNPVALGFLASEIVRVLRDEFGIEIKQLHMPYHDPRP